MEDIEYKEYKFLKHSEIPELRKYIAEQQGFICPVSGETLATSSTMPVPTGLVIAGERLGNSKNGNEKSHY